MDVLVAIETFSPQRLVADDGGALILVIDEFAFDRLMTVGTLDLAVRALERITGQTMVKVRAFGEILRRMTSGAIIGCEFLRELIAMDVLMAIHTELLRERLELENLFRSLAVAIRAARALVGARERKACLGMIKALAVFHLLPIIGGMAFGTSLLQKSRTEFVTVRALMASLATFDGQLRPTINTHLEMHLLGDMTLGALQVEMLSVEHVARALIVIKTSDLFP